MTEDAKELNLSYASITQWVLSKHFEGYKEYSSSWNPISELRSITCHMGSHRWMHPTVTPSSQVGTWFIYPEGIEGWVDFGYWLYSKMVHWCYSRCREFGHAWLQPWIIDKCNRLYCCVISINFHCTVTYCCQWSANFTPPFLSVTCSNSHCYYGGM